MMRPLLQLLLALSLILNGISAPWAMARMNHGDHAEPGATAHAGHAEHAAAAAAHHMHEGAATSHGTGHAHAMADAGSTPIQHDGGACCDGTTCQCGCVLPPVVPFIGLALAPQALTDVAFFSIEQHVALRRDSPPFRPPAA